MPKRLLKPLTDAPSRFAGNLADRIDPPQGERGFLKGLLAGGIQGAGDVASDMTSPVGLASMAIPGASGIRNLFKGAKSANKAVSPTLDLVTPNPVKQVAPSMDDVGSLIGDMRSQLARVPTSKAKGVGPSGVNPSRLPAEMIPPGSEASFNAARPSPVAPKGIEDMIYEMIMSKRGSGLQR